MRGRSRLAVEAFAGIDIAGYLVSEKIDGVRARRDGRQLPTRAGNRIDAPAWTTAGWPQEARSDSRVTSACISAVGCTGR